MSTTAKNRIQLEKEAIEPVVNELDQLLADYHVYYFNLRGVHWNLVGNKFFKLHEKFEAYYTDTSTRIDDVAERIRTLGETPTHTMGEYEKKAQIEPTPHVTEPNACVELVLANTRQLLEQLRNVHEKADKAGDTGTTNMIEDQIETLEKRIWMLSAWLG
jgi:starvation-inducible DNA-binding protein